MLLAGGTTVAAVGGGLLWTSHRVHVPLYSETVAFTAPGVRDFVGVGQADAVVPGTRVFRNRPETARLVRDEAAWLDRCAAWVGRDDQHTALLTAAALDLRVLTEGLPAGVAGWSQLWRYTWPRDASFVAVALHQLGHTELAWQQLSFLAKVHSGPGRFEARYDPVTGRAPDSRTSQLDGSGWALWAIATLAGHTASSSDTPNAQPVPTVVTALARRATLNLLQELDPRTGLPGISPDYWETRENRLTLGTAATTLLGLRSAAQFWSSRDPALATRARSAADRTAAAVSTTFGPKGYPRYPDDDRPDAALTFLLPPFAPGPADDRVIKTMSRAEREMARPGGGLAPGAGWKQDGISWTPQTALFAEAAAWTGRTPAALTRLEWLNNHRTEVGSLPEKVLHDGSPAAVAPLAWTAALVVSTVHRLRNTGA